jgi:fatty acid desaturase
VFYALHSYGPNGARAAARAAAARAATSGANAKGDFRTTLTPQIAPSRARPLSRPRAPAGSALAKERLAALPTCAPPPAPAVPPRPGSAEASAATPSGEAPPLLASFRAFREQLEREGFFRRDVASEAAALGAVLALFAAAAAVAEPFPLPATILLGLGMQQAGWLSHDYIHGRGLFCALMRQSGALLNGHSVQWWVAKHSAHHVWTNTHGLDQDVTQEPFFWLEHPEASGRPDAAHRRFQHWYGYPLYSITFWAWRFASWADVIKRRDVAEGALLAANAAAMLAIYPPGVAVGGVTLAGFLVGSLVSATHQSEGITDERRDFVTAQFASTRDAEAHGAARWLWGGMDTQLEHHLFPSMPRYRYAALRPRLQAWAAANGIEYRMSPWTRIIADNWRTLRDAAAEASQGGKGPGQGPEAAAAQQGGAPGPGDAARVAR